MPAPLAFIVIPVRQLTDKLQREPRRRPNWQALKDDENFYCKVGTVRLSTDGFAEPSVWGSWRDIDGAFGEIALPFISNLQRFSREVL